MKKSFYLISLAAMVIVGCAKEAPETQEQTITPNNKVVALYATMPEFIDAQTKAEVNESGVFTWNESDPISVIYTNGTDEKEIIFLCVDASKGRFEPVDPADIEVGYTLKTEGTVAYYPTGYDGTPSNCDYAMEIDEAKANFQMHATNDNGTLKFVHDNALLKVTVSNVPAFAKTLTVGGVSVNLNLTEAGDVTAYIPVAPAAAAKMSISVTDNANNSIISKSSQESVAITAANLYNLPNLAIGPVVDITKLATSWEKAYVYLFTGNTAFDTEWSSLSTVIKTYNDGTNDHYYRVLPATALGNTYSIIVFNSANDTYRIQSSITIANQNNYSASQLEGLREIGNINHRIIVRDEVLGTDTQVNPDTYFYIKSIDGGNEGATGSWESAGTKALGWFIGKREGSASGRYYYFDTNAISSYVGKSLVFEYTMYAEGHTGDADNRWRGIYNQSGYTYNNYLHLGYYSNSGGSGFYVDSNFDSQMSE